MLDNFACTQAATFTGGSHYASASAKIATFYTPESATFYTPFNSNRVELSAAEKTALRRSKNSQTTAEKALAERAEMRSFLRYQYYVEHGLGDECVSPIKEEWIRNALSLLSTNINQVDEARVEELVRDMLVEMNTDYKQRQEEHSQLRAEK